MKVSLHYVFKDLVYKMKIKISNALNKPKDRERIGQSKALNIRKDIETNLWVKIAIHEQCSEIDTVWTILRTLLQKVE